MKYYIYTISFLIFRLLITDDVFSQTNSSLEIDLVNDVFHEFVPENIDTIYILDCKGGSPIYDQERYKYYKNILDSILDDRITIELLDKSVSNKFDTATIWYKNEIKGAIILSETELDSLAFQFAHSIANRPNKDGENFKIHFDSLNNEIPLEKNIVSESIDAVTNLNINLIVPPDFFTTFKVSRPIIDSTNHYALFYYIMDRHISPPSGGFYLCEKSDDKWEILVELFRLIF